jgi:hypothetical protein
LESGALRHFSLVRLPIFQTGNFAGMNGFAEHSIFDLIGRISMLLRRILFLSFRAERGISGIEIAKNRRDSSLGSE